MDLVFKVPDGDGCIAKETICVSCNKTVEKQCHNLYYFGETSKWFCSLFHENVEESEDSGLPTKVNRCLYYTLNKDLL